MKSLTLRAVSAAGFFVAALFATAQVTATASEVTAAAAFDGAMRSWISKYSVARASVAVMRNDRLVFAEGYGGRRASDRVLLGSLSKAITAFCVGTLVKDGKLRLVEPIGPLLKPIFKRFGLAVDARLADVTIAQLLSHRSGIPRVADGNKFAPGVSAALRQRPPQKTTVYMLMPAILRVSLVRPPGSGYEYSNRLPLAWTNYRSCHGYRVRNCVC